MDGVFFALFVAAAVVLAGAIVARELAAFRHQETQHRVLDLFAHALTTAPDDPPRLLAWYRLAQTARALYPDAFKAIDAAQGARFPFTRKHVQAAHARWTAQWLAWERTHDAECKLKAAALEAELGPDADTDFGRLRIEALEREKLDRYQQRYEEYVRIAKELAALDPDASA